MNLTSQQLAHILAALRYCQEKDLSMMPHFEETDLLSSLEIDDLCEQINEDHSDLYTVVGLFPDSEWNSSMRDATSVEHITAENPIEAVRLAREQMARSRIRTEEGMARSAIDEEVERFGQDIEILAVFHGHLDDLFDPAEELPDEAASQDQKRKA